MKINIIGSGGCESTPKPCCKCHICTEARKRGFPYARTGCSLYIEEDQILFDTPEDINYSIINADIDDVKCVFYSHMDPDHTMGMRVFEQLRLDWAKKSINAEEYDPIQVSSLPQVMKDLYLHRTKYGSIFDYYEKNQLIKPQPGEHFTFNTVTIHLVPVDNTNTVTTFVITEGDKKVIYAPCDVKPFPDNELFYQADILIIGNTIVGDVLKDGFVMKEDNPLLSQLFVMEEIVALQQKYDIKRVVITHLEEGWGKSYDDYKELEKRYRNIQFAYDGMKIEL